MSSSGNRVLLFGALLSSFVALPACVGQEPVRCVAPPLGGPGTTMFDVHATGRTLAFGDGSLWFLQDAQPQRQPLLARLDPATGDVSTLAPVPQQLDSLHYGFRRVWGIVHRRDGTDRVVAYDGASGRQVLSAELPSQAGQWDLGEGSVWLTDALGELLRIDPESGSIAHVVLQGEATGVVVGLGSIWVAVQTQVGPHRVSNGLAQMNPRTGAMMRTVPRATPMAVAQDVLWVVGPGEPNGALRKLDPTTGKLLPGIVSTEGIQPSGAVPDGQSTWIVRYHYYCALHNPVPEGPPIVDWVAYRLQTSSLHRETRDVRITTNGSSLPVSADGSLWSLVGDGPGHLIRVSV